MSAIALLLTTFLAQPDTHKYDFSQMHMGVEVRVTLFAASRDQAERAASSAFSEFKTLDETASDYIQTSELMKLCGKAGQGFQKVSFPLQRMIEVSKEFHTISNGCFDITLGPLTSLWRECRRKGQLPPVDKIAKARALCGMDKIVVFHEVDDRYAYAYPKHYKLEAEIMLRTSGMKLDLGGIAKGWACDMAIEALRKEGVKSALVQAGGDIVCSDAPPRARGWEINIPALKKDVFLSNKAVSTSGDASQFVEVNGVKYSHILDPRTGVGVTNRVMATVIADHGWESDPLTKQICIEPEAGVRTARSRGAQAYYVRAK